MEITAKDYSKSGWLYIAKYPITIFSVLLALIIAKYSLGITFGPVAEISGGGVKFTQAEKGEFSELSSRLNGALEEIQQLKNWMQNTDTFTVDESAIFEASQTVSDETAMISMLTAKEITKGNKTGYIWIGNYRERWRKAKLSMIGTGQPISVPPERLVPGTEYKVLGNMVLRDKLPNNNAAYYKERKSLGTISRGTKVRIVGTPEPIDREFAVQYWVEIELPH